MCPPFLYQFRVVALCIPWFPHVKSSLRQGVCLHLARKLHAPAHAGVVHQTGQGKAVLRGVVVAAGTSQLHAAACFPDLILKAVDVHRAADDLRLFALHFQRHGAGR